MSTIKPAKVKLTEETKNQAVAIAATDPQGDRVRAAAEIVGTREIKDTYAETTKRIAEEAHKFEEGMDNLKKKKNQPAVEVKAEVKNEGPKLR